MQYPECNLGLPDRFLETCPDGIGQTQQWHRQKRPESLLSQGAGRCWPAEAAALLGAS